LLLPLVWSAGGTLFDDQGRLTVQDPALIRVLMLLRTMVERGYLPEDVLSFHWWDPPRMLAKGEVPMTLGGTYEWPTIVEAAELEGPELARRLGFVPVPRPTLDADPVVSLGGTTWAVMRESPQHALAVEVLRLAMEPETALSFSQQEFQISPLKSVNRRLLEQGEPWLKKVVPLLAFARPRPMLEEYVQVSRFLQKLFESVLVDGVPVETAVLQTGRTLDLLLGH
jgi:multiple sugar transport system substrate-binding protein